ncbi:inorganic phosphate transporter [Parachlamydia sp. AcF125]|uniref:inorganic phosphate transporter n=1 Tax=Parachlamydia sp. AcF125 TaxID=2795736 RepID=UPI001BC951D3|nr:inorganic phosphate transporter [Parachlamydia sp. AcF125]MBS4167942.1 Low-affinity inorganic phosphate transporter 1 [Parachlamydia sp. AcF125]
MIWVIVAVICALIFDFVNGVHDAANSIATAVSTRVLKPRTAIFWAAGFNFAAIFLFVPRVAETMSKMVKIEPSQSDYVLVVLIGISSAILWNAFTWFLSIPSSSSHALIGGYAGAGLAHAGWHVLDWEKLSEIFFFIVLGPFLGFFVGSILMVCLCRIFYRCSPSQLERGFRKGQLISAAFYSLAHGANDAQKTMGIILAILVAAGLLEPNVKLSLFNLDTLWIILFCQAALSLGTALGGWRIVKTMGMKIAKIRAAGGFCAESAGAMTLFLATSLGVPVSSTQTMTGAIMGVGSVGKKLSSIKWKIVFQMMIAWILTIPSTAGVAICLSFLHLHVFGKNEGILKGAAAMLN